MERCRQCGTPEAKEALNDGLCPSCLRLREAPDGLSKATHIAGVPFTDMKQVDEDKRLKVVAAYLNENRGKIIGVMVDTGPGYEDKGDRYVRTIRQLVPTVKLIGRFPGPRPGVETIQFLKP